MNGKLDSNRIRTDNMGLNILIRMLITFLGKFFFETLLAS